MLLLHIICREMKSFSLLKQEQMQRNLACLKFYLDRFQSRKIFSLVIFLIF